MGSISMVESRLPPGFRFHPRDDELVLDYLSFKLTGGNNTNAGNIFFSPMLIDIDLNKCEPWDLPEIACVGGKDWYFYSLRDRKYATGQRTNRATQSGYWKATGKDRSISRKGALVGMRKTLVFYQGRAPKGKKTEWVMHEFRMEGVFTDPPKFSLKEDWVLCKVFHKSKSANPRPNIDSFLNESATVTMPPLVDSSYINFDQSEQISNFCNMGPPVRSFNDSNNNNISIGGILELGSDRKAIKAMLNNITKFEGQMENYMFNPF